VASEHRDRVVAALLAMTTGTVIASIFRTQRSDLDRAVA